MAFESELEKEQILGDGEKDFDGAQFAEAEGLDEAPDFMSSTDEDDEKENLPPSVSEEDSDRGLY